MKKNTYSLNIFAQFCQSVLHILHHNRECSTVMHRLKSRLRPQTVQQPQVRVASTSQ